MVGNYCQSPRQKVIKPLICSIAANLLAIAKNLLLIVFLTQFSYKQFVAKRRIADQKMIPDWNISAVLPPVRPGAAGHSPDRSPFKASLSEVVERFGKNSARLDILRGLLNYRAELRRRGILTGFQWLDGSFMEHKEVLVQEPPKDIDVVTFFNLPNGLDQAAFLPQVADLFDVANTKQIYHVDAYPFVLGAHLGEIHVIEISYWYSLWSHRRDNLWKGFVQVDISEDEDNNAMALLAQIEQELATQ